MDVSQDRVGYKLLLDANNLRTACQHGRPGKWAPIVIQDEYNESQYEAYEYIYAPVSVLFPMAKSFLECALKLRLREQIGDISRLEMHHRSVATLYLCRAEQGPLLLDMHV